MPVSVIFNQINTNSLSKNSSINNGQNNQPDWTFQAKFNYGIGMTVGINNIVGNGNFNIDCDGVDQPITNPELINPQPNIQF